MWRMCVASLTLIVVFCAMPAGADVKLPVPNTSGGVGVLDALKNRASAGPEVFSASGSEKKLSQENLATLLWAATGPNRPEKGWTVPMAMGREPYAKVYVAGEEGTFLYDWKSHALIELSKEDSRSTVGAQPFIAQAPYVLIFATDGRALESHFGNTPRRAEWGYVAVGAMTQNVYLAAQAAGAEVRYVASLKEDAVRSLCRLDPADTPVCIMPVGIRR